MMRSTIGLYLGLILFLLFLVFPRPQDMPIDAMHVAAVAILMATWWITEAIPIPATALLPIILFPILGVMDGSLVTQAYANHLIYLFLGGFLIAIAVEKWNLHRRIALHTLRIVGVTPNRIILGFMLATAFLSMWISNTAASMMMMTIGLAVLNQISSGMIKHATRDIDFRPGYFHFGTALMLGIAYAASIGGIATLIGTPPNAILAGVIENTYGHSISFLKWMLFGLPLSVTMFFITWYYLTRFAYPSEVNHLPGSSETIKREILKLGPITSQEKKVLTIFAMVAALWIGRGLIDINELTMVKDSTIAMTGALLLFIIPSNLKKREFLLDWESAVKVPWDILILFGGGFALAQGFSESGLTHYLAEQLSILKGSNLVIVITGITILIIFLTEITSNTATASLAVPVMGALALTMQVHPYALMTVVAVAASFAFMLPVATPPNAIIFSSRYVTIQQMVKTGIWLNMIGVALITIFATFILPIVWNIDITEFPQAWNASTNK